MSTDFTNETESIGTTTVEESMATESIEPGQTKSIESIELESIEPIDELETTESNEPNASNKSTESTEESEDNKGGGLDVESTSSSELNLSFDQDQDILNDSMVESETSDITSSVNGDSGVFFDSACEKQKSQKLPPLCIDVSIKI